MRVCILIILFVGELEKCKRDPNLISYSPVDGGPEQCAQYFECEGTGKERTARPKCCRDGFAYKNGDCVEDSTCKHYCAHSALIEEDANMTESTSPPPSTTPPRKFYRSIHLCGSLEV